MVTALLQLANGVLLLCFALVARRLARLPVFVYERPVHRTAWWVTWHGFLVTALSALAQDVAAIWAVASGRGSAPWELVVRWVPSGNDGRLAVGVALSTLLALLAVGDHWALWRHRALLPALFLAAHALGSVAALGEPPLQGHAGAHFANVALGSAVELGTTLVALLLGLLRDALPRYLWLALAAWALKMFVATGSFSVLAWIDVPGSWTLPPWLMEGQTLALSAGMLALAARRLTLGVGDARRRAAVVAVEA